MNNNQAIYFILVVIGLTLAGIGFSSSCSLISSSADSSPRYGSAGEYIDLPCGMAVDAIHPRLNDAPGIVLRPFQPGEIPENWVYQDLNGENRYTLIESGCWLEN
jgi:hypothetical protein